MGKKNHETTHFSFGYLKKSQTTKNQQKTAGFHDDLKRSNTNFKLHHLRRCSKSYLNTLWSASGWFRWHFWWEERGWQELKTNNHVILLGIIKKRVKQKYVEISTTTCLYHTTKVPFLDHSGNQKKTRMMICSWEKLSTRRTVQQIQVRKIQELDVCDALVIPGGESTTMKIIAGTDEILGSQMMGNEGRRTKE